MDQAPFDGGPLKSQNSKKVRIWGCRESNLADLIKFGTKITVGNSFCGRFGVIRDKKRPHCISGCKLCSRFGSRSGFWGAGDSKWTIWSTRGRSGRPKSDSARFGVPFGPFVRDPEGFGELQGRFLGICVKFDNLGVPVTQNGRFDQVWNKDYSRK